MIRISRKIAATALAAAAMTMGTLATATPASAASYGGQCGSGYGVVNQFHLPDSRGTVFLTYSSSTGRNCVIAKRNTAGSAVLIEAGLSVSPAGNHWTAYQGNYYTSYAGPIYLSAAGRCVDWMGRISGTEGGKRGTNCG
jgi:hypothetical protein